MKTKSKKLYLGRQRIPATLARSPGGFIEIFGDVFYRIENYDRLPPFFISVVSDSDHWLFVSTTGGLSAGRVSPDSALFPYYTVDRIHENAGNTGPFTVLHVPIKKRMHFWQPFQRSAPEVYRVTRQLYKNTTGNQIIFEETNYDLGLAFRYSWSTSDRFGFVRESVCTNVSNEPREVTVLDGLLNILPASVNRRLQNELSYLVDGYKMNELVDGSRLALFRLAAGIRDEAIPMESLRATSVWSHGLTGAQVLLSEPFARAAARGEEVTSAQNTRGLRGAYVLRGALNLAANESQSWQIVADVEQTQKQVAALAKKLPGAEEVAADVRRGQERLIALIGAADGLQKTADQLSTAHHFANTLFNCMRGGVFADGDRIAAPDFAKFVRECNTEVAAHHADWLAGLPDIVREADLRARVRATDDPDLIRIFFEYLPITFSRRHGDPSRPWNKFAIKIKDDAGRPLLGFEGNWRDIFQNWEALSLSNPSFLEHMIAKFVNASTIDGYNPYRITRDGVDWEEIDPHDPWASIGYWGDHQIVYLLKLLEASAQFHPGELTALLADPIFVYADVPYRIAPYEKMLVDPHVTIHFDAERNRAVKARAARIGSDGKLATRADGAIFYVNFTEKLLVPLLAKLSNFIPGGGIWMNTQRPEWNDANNALVGYGVSVVTLNYLRRYLAFCLELFATRDDAFEISAPVVELLREIARVFERATNRRAMVDQLSSVGSRYREAVYANAPAEKQTLKAGELRAFFEAARQWVDDSLRANRRPDRLYHAYNLLAFSEGAVAIEFLPEMLEGQVAALSSGLLEPEESLRVLRALRKSALYRADAKSYLLYPDKRLPSFLEKNIIPDSALTPALQRMLAAGDERIICRDNAGHVRFAACFVNARVLEQELARLNLGEEVDSILAIYESVFHHHAFTGRSGSMFAFEGLGSIYWHMVAKLLLAAQECFWRALEQKSKAVPALAAAYYEIRSGLGFNKTPEAYGAFPTDPYSHSPAHTGAEQPGMTGQVKEEILTRLGELGVRVRDGIVHFQPALLRASEFLREPTEFSCVMSNGERRAIALAKGSLAFTFCQTPIIYQLADSQAVHLARVGRDSETHIGNALSAEASQSLFQRDGEIDSITVDVPAAVLLEC